MRGPTPCTTGGKPAGTKTCRQDLAYVLEDFFHLDLLIHTFLGIFNWFSSSICPSFRYLGFFTVQCIFFLFLLMSKACPYFLSTSRFFGLTPAKDYFYSMEKKIPKSKSQILACILSRHPHMIWKGDFLFSQARNYLPVSGL